MTRAKPLPKPRIFRLQNRLLYWAHPIDLTVLEPDRYEALTAASALLQNHGACLYAPAMGFQVPLTARPRPVISEINRHALGRCDALVAWWPEAETIGVPMELAMAESLGMPCLVVSAASGKSWALAGVRTARTVSQVTDGDAGWLGDAITSYRLARGPSPGADPDVLWFECEHPELLPTRSHADDAGFDLYVAEDTEIGPGASIDVPCGVAVQLPAGIWGLVMGRSSTLRKHDLMVEQGVIDTGYRGPLFALVHNIGSEPFVAKEGMRLAQLIPMPALAHRMVASRAVELDSSERGTAGFGSSGD